MSDKPGSGWYLKRYGRKVAVFAVPRIRDWRLHGRVHLGGRGVCLGIWWGEDDEGTMDLTIGYGFGEMTFWLAHFHPYPYTPPPWGDTDE